MRLATHDDLVAMERGTPVIVNLVDEIPDISLFLEYIPTRKKILVIDTYLKDKQGRYHANICEYDRCLMLELTDEQMATLAHTTNTPR